MRSVYDNLTVSSFAPQFNTTGATVAVSSSVDTKGYNSAALRVYTGTVGSGLTVALGSSLTALLQESDDNSTFTSALDNTGTAIGFTVQATTTAVVTSARIEGLGNLNRKRYLRVQTTGAFGQAKATNGFTSVALIELGRSYTKPVNTTVSNT